MYLGESVVTGQYLIQLQETLNKKYPKKFGIMETNH